MTFDPKKPVQTKSGKKVSLVTTEGIGGYPLIGYMGERTFPELWTKEGKLHEGCESPLDLINIPEERDVWVNVYDDGVWAPHKRKIDADIWAEARIADNKSASRIARLHIRYTVGQMDE